MTNLTKHMEFLGQRDLATVRSNLTWDIYFMNRYYPIGVAQDEIFEAYLKRTVGQDPKVNFIYYGCCNFFLNTEFKEMETERSNASIYYKIEDVEELFDLILEFSIKAKNELNLFEEINNFSSQLVTLNSLLKCFDAKLENPWNGELPTSDIYSTFLRAKGLLEGLEDLSPATLSKIFPLAFFEKFPSVRMELG